MAKLFTKEQLPHYESTRDTRDRLDLVKPGMSLGARRIAADRVRYNPGDTAVAHYHTGSLHLFYVMEGQGWMYVNGEQRRLKAGMVALIFPGEIHWFENDTQEYFSFVEFWAPPPDETVWITDDC